MAIDLWAAQLTRSLTAREEAALMSLLPQERRERLERVKNHDRWREVLCAYAILRHALWQQYHWREFPQVRKTSFGKPYFPEFPTVHFNLSHTGGAVIVGLSDEPIGVDIEKIRPVSERSMQRLAGVVSEKAFFQSWVRREARAKRGGAGIGTMMEDDTPLQKGESFYYLDTFDGYVAGVATRSNAVPNQLIRYSLDDML
ncbi:MAG: 4'-phosphopantetheinyl transferase [Oscillibacter sp.]|jgi:4'-phosphopantetheinyl transferase|nr:4'-phosphopantetheinyl transferase [Oscillibacter sp.]